MGALGDYIHLKISNYRKYGVANETGGNEDIAPMFYNYCDSKTFINERLNRISEVSDEAINILRSRLKANTPDGLTKEEQAWGRDQQRLINYIYELLYTQVNNINKGAKVLVETTSGQGKYSNKETKQLQTLSATFQWASGYSHSQLMQLRSKKQKQLQEIKRLIAEINKGKQPQSDTNLKKLTQLYTKFTDIIPNQQFNTVAEIEKAIAAFRYTGTIQQVAGKFGEQLVAICDDTAEDMGKKELVNFLQTAVQGDVRTEITFDKDLIAPGKATFLRTTDESGNEYYLGTTQDKTDVHIHIKDEDIFASVKDYAAEPGSFKNPHLQNVNLLQSLTFLNSYLDNFGNHWLNMHALKGSGGWSNQKEADAIVLKEIAYEALASGSPFKQSNPANVFVYIDRAKGYVFVEKTSDLLLNHFDRFIMRSVEDIILKNRRVPLKNGIQDRIEDILRQVHKINIAVSLNITPR